MTFKIAVKIELRDKNGKVIKTLIKRPHSYVIGLIDGLYGLFVSPVNASTNVSIKDTANQARSMAFPVTSNGYFYGAFSLLGGAGDANLGIAVGTGETAIAITDYKLTTLIAHGNAATQLSYGATSVGLPATVGTTRQFTIARTFTNNSGAAIAVKETGLIANAYIATTGYRFLIEHSLLSFTIANGTSGTVTYTISVTV